VWAASQFFFFLPRNSLVNKDQRDARDAGRKREVYLSFCGQLDGKEHVQTAGASAATLVSGHLWRAAFRPSFKCLD
jgi:hypothetical protein